MINTDTKTTLSAGLFTNPTIQLRLLREGRVHGEVVQLGIEEHITDQLLCNDPLRGVDGAQLAGHIHSNSVVFIIVPMRRRCRCGCVCGGAGVAEQRLVVIASYLNGGHLAMPVGLLEVLHLLLVLFQGVDSLEGKRD